MSEWGKKKKKRKREQSVIDKIARVRVRARARASVRAYRHIPESQPATSVSHSFLVYVGGSYDSSTAFDTTSTNDSLR